MATTLLEYFNELRDQNPFSWVKDSEITAVEPGHAEMTLQTNDTEYCNFRGDLHGAVCIEFCKKSLNHFMQAFGNRRGLSLVNLWVCI